MSIIAPVIGIDLGTAYTKVYTKKKGITINEPTVAVVEKGRKNRVVYHGMDAQIAAARLEEGYAVIRPLQDGVITDFDSTVEILRYFVTNSISYSVLGRPAVYVTYPGSLSPIERRALKDAVIRGGGNKKKVYLVDKAYASALGANLPVFEPTGSMIIDVGAGTTDIAVISYGGTVISRSVRVGGDKMNEAIRHMVAQELNISICDRIAEELKIDLGAALPVQTGRSVMIRGREMLTGLPTTAEVTSAQLQEALSEPCQAILSAIKWVLERTPPELSADIMCNGIHLTGGSSQLYGFDQFIASNLGLQVLTDAEPTDSAIRGLGYIIENINELTDLGRQPFLLEDA